MNTPTNTPTLTSVNYREGISILHKRFGDKQPTIARHMDVLLNIEAVTAQHNVKGLLNSLHNGIKIPPVCVTNSSAHYQT